MTFARFLGVMVGMVLAAVVLVWILGSLGAVVFALLRGDREAAGLFAGFAVAGLAVAVMAWWVVRVVAGARRERQ